MKIRLDELLVSRGLVRDVTVARSVIIQGLVHNINRKLLKPGEKYAHDIMVDIKFRKSHQYVARSAMKLVHALDYFTIDPSGMVCIDIGCSTGGFTQVLLQRGANLIFAVDVGYGEFHNSLRYNSNIVLLERTNARFLTADHIHTAPQLLVCDASFIRIENILPAALSLMSQTHHVVTLIKPQFEVEKYEVGHGGIVTEKFLHDRVCKHIAEWFMSNDYHVHGIIPSNVLGTKGNQEFLLYATKG
jgi:23S rRNA (cytidine1920-2'-O)/16S rRNA (cytidine1409-2'-O)-methyltransferase